MKKNPFSPAYPVDPRYFVNRTDILAMFKTAIERSTKAKYPTPDNIAILGEWGIGKSSVLKKFEHIALEEFPSRKIFCALVELIPASCDSFASFSEKIIDDVGRNFITSASLLSKIRNEIKNWKTDSIGIGSIMSAKKEIHKKSTAANFTDYLINLWEMLEKSGVDTGIIMLDDLYYLVDKYPDALYDLRGIFQGLPRHGCNFMLCCTGKRELFSRIRELAEPLSRFFNIKYSLDLFSQEETKDAILMPIKRSEIDINIDDSVIAEIHRLSIGHPFFIHFIMRELVSLNIGKKINMAVFKDAYQKIENTMNREKFAVDCSVASAKEKEVLVVASGLKKAMFMPQDVKIKGIRHYLRMLVKKNLIIKHERGEYSLYHPLFKEYLKTIK